MHTEWIARELGVLTTIVSAAKDENRLQFGELHRRLNYQDQWLRFMLKRIDKRNGNGNHKIPYGKAAAFGVLLIIGILAQAYPGATKKASLDLLEKFLLSAVKG